MSGRKRHARQLVRLVEGVMDPVEVWTQDWVDGNGAHTCPVFRVDPRGRASMLAGLQGELRCVWELSPTSWNPPIAIIAIRVTRPSIGWLKLAFEAVGEELGQLAMIAEQGIFGVTLAPRGQPLAAVLKVPTDELRAFLEGIRG